LVAPQAQLVAVTDRGQRELGGIVGAEREGRELSRLQLIVAGVEAETALQLHVTEGDIDLADLGNGAALPDGSLERARNPAILADAQILHQQARLRDVYRHLDA